MKNFYHQGRMARRKGARKGAKAWKEGPSCPFERLRGFYPSSCSIFFILPFRIYSLLNVARVPL
jgi:hypothetical protein